MKWAGPVELASNISKDNDYVRDKINKYAVHSCTIQIAIPCSKKEKCDIKTTFTRCIVPYRKAHKIGDETPID